MNRVEISGNFGQIDYTKMPNDLARKIQEPIEDVVLDKIRGEINTRTGATEANLTSKSIFDIVRGLTIEFISSVAWAIRLEYKSKSYMRAGIRAAKPSIRKILKDNLPESVKATIRKKR